MKKLKEQGIKCVGIDYHNLKQKSPGNFVQADAHALPFADASFKFVVSQGMFDENFYKNDVNTILLEVCRVLEPGGIFSGHTIYISDLSDEVKERFTLGSSGVTVTYMIKK